jgi:hypothetical protein
MGMDKFTFTQLCEMNEAETPYLYHATFTKNIPKILKKGLRQFNDSLWVQSGTGKRYNEDAGIFAFEHPEDALKWAIKMEWEFETSDISIVRFKSSKHWEKDPATDISLQLGKGRSLRSFRDTPASDIIDVFPIEKFGKPGPRGMGVDEWLDEATKILSGA